MVAAEFSNALWMYEHFHAVKGKMVETTSMQPVEMAATTGKSGVSISRRRVVAAPQPAQARWPLVKTVGRDINSLTLGIQHLLGNLTNH
jgi:hypothetical protein